MLAIACIQSEQVQSSEDSLVSRYIPRFTPISEEFPNRKQDELMKYCHEYTDHSVGRKFPPSLFDTEYSRMKSETADNQVVGY